MLGRLFSRPKWQHRKSEVRIEGVRGLPEGDPILANLVRTDPDADVRCHVVRKLLDTELLLGLRSDDADHRVRDAARQRLCRLVSCGETQGLTAERREALAWRLDDEESIGYLLAHADLASVRRLMVERLQKPSALADVALNDGATEVRQAAVGRIDQLSTLERVARLAKGRDKHVARLAREKADALRAEAQRPQQQQTIDESLKRLVDSATPDIVRFRQLTDEWEAARKGASDERIQSVTSSIEAFERLYAVHQAAAERAARERELCERAEALAQEVSNTNFGSDAVAGGRDALNLLATAWKELAAEGEGPAMAGASRFTAATDAARTRLDQLAASAAARSELRTLVEELEGLADAEALPDARALEALDKRWAASVKSHGKAAAEDIASDYRTVRQRARARIDSARKAESDLIEEVDKLLGELAHELEAGELQHAISLHDKAKDRLEKLRALGSGRSAGLGKRLRPMSGRVAELRDWRRYGLDQVRDELVDRMEALVGSDRSPIKLAAEIRKLQDRWRELDAAGGVAPEKLWARFSEARERAFAPCAAHFAEVEKARDAAVQARADFCDGLEAECAATDGEAPDWAAMDRRLRQARRQWREMGGVEPAEWRKLDKRFNGIAERFEARLAPERERETSRRERLIAEIEALASESDTRRATERAKQAQASWAPTVPSGRKVEQALWKRFREACDAVFARAGEQREAQRQAVDGLRAAREALCEAAERLAANEAESWDHARAELAALGEAWKAAPVLPSRMAAAFDRRFDKALADFRRAEQAAGDRLRHRELELRDRRTVLCQRLEAHLQTAMDEAEREAARRQWDELPPLADSALQDRFDQRFDRLCRALDGGPFPDAELKDNARDLRRLCLEMEIFAGVDSPAGMAAERLALQVERLPQAMMGGGAPEEGSNPFDQLLMRWQLSGPVRPADRAEAVARFERARSILEEGASGRS